MFATQSIVLGQRFALEYGFLFISRLLLHPASNLHRQLKTVQLGFSDPGPGAVFQFVPLIVQHLLPPLAFDRAGFSIADRVGLRELAYAIRADDT
ncbi:hypothetical protein D3C80_1007740 [compost metagenome]